MKNDLSSYRDRLLARVRPEFRPEADRFLRNYSNDPNEPIFWFFALLIDEQGLTREEVDRQKWHILALTCPDNWKRIVYSWFMVPVLLAAFVLTGVAYLNHQNMATIRKLSENPAEVAAYAASTLKALEVANDNAASISAIADLLHVPEASAGLRDGRLVVVVPNHSISVEPQGETRTRLTFVGQFRSMFGHLHNTHEAATETKPTSP